MVKHIILWKIKEEYSKKEKEEIKAGVKEGLEALKGVVLGLSDIHVQIEALDTSNADIMLDSVFENEAALKTYAIHPAHVKVVNEKVRPFMEIRLCMDFEK